MSAAYFSLETLRALELRIQLTLADGKVRQVILPGVHDSELEAMDIQEVIDELSGDPLVLYPAPHFGTIKGWSPHWSIVIARKRP